MLNFNQIMAVATAAAAAAVTAAAAAAVTAAVAARTNEVCFD
jgi:hypothetical protein